MLLSVWHNCIFLWVSISVLLLFGVQKYGFSSSPPNNRGKNCPLALTLVVWDMYVCVLLPESFGGVILGFAQGLYLAKLAPLSIFPVLFQEGIGYV